MWQPSWSTANLIYELSQVLFLAGILMSGIAIAGMVWMAPLRNLAVNLETARSPQTENFQAGKEQLARVIAERGSRPERMTDEQTNILSANLGDAVQTMLIIRVNDTEAANIAKQLAAAFVKARIPARVGVMESEGAPSRLVLYDPDAAAGLPSRGASSRPASRSRGRSDCILAFQASPSCWLAASLRHRKSVMFRPRPTRGPTNMPGRGTTRRHRRPQGPRVTRLRRTRSIHFQYLAKSWTSVNTDAVA
jgi:hypothetical protein